MTRRYTAHIIFLLLLLAAIQTQAQKWYTAEVALELGREPCEGCGIGRVREDINSVQVRNGRITPVTMFYFDTIATYAQGRVVDIATGKPIKNAFIQVRYSCWDDCSVKAAASNETGFFQQSCGFKVVCYIRIPRAALRHFCMGLATQSSQSAN